MRRQERKPAAARAPVRPGRSGKGWCLVQVAAGHGTARAVEAAAIDRHGMADRSVPLGQVRGRRPACAIRHLALPIRQIRKAIPNVRPTRRKVRAIPFPPLAPCPTTRCEHFTNCRWRIDCTSNPNLDFGLNCRAVILPPSIPNPKRKPKIARHRAIQRDGSSDYLFGFSGGCSLPTA
jgi:hypothetical protein